MNTLVRNREHRFLQHLGMSHQNRPIIRYSRCIVSGIYAVAGKNSCNVRGKEIESRGKKK